MNPFLITYRITQQFGMNQDYYKQFGLKGHEGIDLVPVKECYGIHAVESGTVIVDEDNPDGRVYGISVRIRSGNRVWIYAHMSENTVKVGQVVSVGDIIGVMGNTGGSHGAHLHLSVYEVDEKGNKVAPNNGYAGCVDPLPIMEGG
jgi:murein DD-endopeptidase MepM/ murein hydrolase activator NlpD